MLPATARLTRRVDFAAVIRRGRRSGRHLLIVHSSSTSDGPVRAGFVVSKAVGGSVTRHRVVRRLRHLLRARLDQLAPGTQIVVRALPAAADASSVELAVELDAALQRLGLTPVWSR